MVEQRFGNPFKTPIMLARMDRWGHTYHDGTYFVCHCHAVQLASASLVLANKRYGPYGAFQAMAKLSGAVKFNSLYLFGLERRHGHPSGGLICFFYSGLDEKYYACSQDTEGMTLTDLGTLDWSDEQTFRIDWAAGRIDFRIDVKPEATHFTNVPSVPMSWFIEAMTQEGSPPASEGIVYQRKFEEV